MTGKFIALEGIDGSGKSTQIKLLSERLENAYITCEPTNGAIGKLIRDIMSGKIFVDPYTCAHLFSADRIEHLMNEENGMVKLLKSGKNVISDRYIFSSLAYQGVQIPMEYVYELNKKASEILMPDLTVFIDIPINSAIKRISENRESTDIYETKDRLIKVRENYLEAFKMFGNTTKILKVDGEKSVSEISDIIFNEVISL